MRRTESVDTINQDTYRVGRIDYHNRSSTDFGMKILFPTFNPPAPTPSKQALTIPGANGDYSDGARTYGAVDVQVGVVIRIPKRYKEYGWFEGWSLLKSDITNWLYGDPDWLKFELDPDYLYSAEVMSAPQFTPVNSERINATITFHLQPFKFEADNLKWKPLELGTTIAYNKENTNVRPDWHINGTGSFLLKVNGVPYEFDDLDGDIYLLGDESNAYSADPDKINAENELLNTHLRLANNEAPELLCVGNGENTISFEKIDADATLNKFEFKPKYRRLI